MRDISRHRVLRRDSWPSVRGAVRLHLMSESSALPELVGVSFDSSEAHTAAARVLRDAGFLEEASVLGDRQVWDAARRLVRAGRSLTPSDPAYPRRLLESMGRRAPPAFFTIPAPLGVDKAADAPAAIRWAAIVGSRRPQPSDERAVEALVRAVHARGMGIVSGGASGIDRMALLAAQRVGCPYLEIQATGLSMPRYGRAISLAPPTAEFTTAQAMERNGLIYACADASFVFRPRFKQGGSWHGALGALRGALSPVGIWHEGDPSALRALQAAGAMPFGDAGWAEGSSPESTGAMGESASLRRVSSFRSRSSAVRAWGSSALQIDSDESPVQYPGGCSASIPAELAESVLDALLCHRGCQPALLTCADAI